MTELEGIADDLGVRWLLAFCFGFTAADAYNGTDELTLPMDCGPDIGAIGMVTADELAKPGGPMVGMPYMPSDEFPTDGTPDDVALPKKASGGLVACNCMEGVARTGDMLLLCCGVLPNVCVNNGVFNPVPGGPTLGTEANSAAFNAEPVPPNKEWKL